jgi:hypothetical protein
MIAAAFLSIVIILALLSHAQEPAEGANGAPHFKHIKPSEFVGNTFTHVETNGIVRYVRGENDGDVHVMVCETPSSSGTVHHWLQGCVLAECIPAVPLACKVLHHGDLVTIWGISRYDRWHRWNEIHPVLGVAVLDKDCAKRQKYLEDWHRAHPNGSLIRDCSKVK